MLSSYQNMGGEGGISENYFLADAGVGAKPGNDLPKYCVTVISIS